MAIEPQSKRDGTPPWAPETLASMLEMFDEKSCEEEHMDWDEVEWFLAESHRTLKALSHMTPQE